MDGKLEVEFRLSRKGTEQLFINGYQYTCNRRTEGSVYWRCPRRYCNASAVFNNGRLKSASGQHTCSQVQDNQGPCIVEMNNTLPLDELAPKVLTSNFTPSPSPPKLFPIFFKSHTYPKHEVVLQSKSTSVTVVKQEDEGECLATSREEPIQIETSQMAMDAEKARRLQETQEIRDAWTENRNQFKQKCSLAESKWRESRAVWSCSFDWPTRTHCMKLIKPIRGTGAQVEQGEVPIKIIDAVEALYTVKTTTDTDEATTVTKPRKKQKVSPNEDVRQLLAEKNGVKVITSDKTASSTKQKHSFWSESTIGGDAKPFGCDKCPVRFTSRPAQKRHLLLHLNGFRHFRCLLCNKRFRKEKIFLLHNKKVHPGTSCTANLRKLEVMSDDEDISKNISWRGKIVKNPAEFDFGSSALTRNRQNATGKEEELPPEMAAGPSAVKPSRHFTIDELKYVDFLQPKVVLSRALAQFLLTWSNDTLEPLFRPDSADIPNAINDYLVASI